MTTDIRRFVPSLLIVATFSLSLSAQVFVNEDFESYTGPTTDADFEAAWPPFNQSGTPIPGAAGVIVPRTTAPFPDPPYDGSGDAGVTPPLEPLTGQAVTFPNIPTAQGGGLHISSENFSIQPSETQAVKLSADVLDYEFTNRRASVGMRDGASAFNLIELGYYNQITTDPRDPNVEIGVTAYAYRITLFAGFGGDLVQQPNWQYFELPIEFDSPDVDHNGDGKFGNGDGIVSPLDVGPGWHRFSATVSLDEVTVELDLFRDGMVDATQSWPMNYNTGGFYDNLRFGGPSGFSVNQLTMFDNIRLELVDPTGGLTCDFNDSGTCDIADIDLLYGMIGTMDPLFDLDGSGTVDNADITEWLAQASAADPLGRTFKPGDTDLNGNVEGSDFTQLALEFGTQNAAWGLGNFDGDINNFEVGGSDFTSLALNFGFTSPINGVPEPAMVTHLLIGMGLLLGLRRR